jgi:hypothetical protein
MSIRTFASRSVAALAGASMLTLSLGPATALTLPGPSLEQSVSTSQIDKVWWRGGWGWHGGWHGGWRGGWGWRRGWGWGPAAVVGGLAAGAIVAGAAAPYYGYGYGNNYGPCWRQVVGPYGGWTWQRVC